MRDASEPIVELLRTGGYGRCEQRRTQSKDANGHGLGSPRGELSKNLTEAPGRKTGRKIALKPGRVAGGGQLLGPDEDTLPSTSFVVHDQGRAEALEVLDGELQVAEIENHDRCPRAGLAS